MSFWNFARRTAMPVIPDQNTVYFVADPLNPGLCDAFVSGNLGNVRKIKGDTSTGGARYVHTQWPAASTWVINHNLGFTPAVSVYSIGGIEVEAEIAVVSPNQIQVLFLTATAGTASLT